MEQNIGKMNENGVLLTKILKISGYKGSVRKCRKLLHDQAPNLQGYLYRFKGPKFPSNFSYFFLNSILFKENEDNRSGRGQILSKDQNLDFIIEECKDLDILEKLLKPALDFHNLAIINASNSIDGEEDEDLTDNPLYKVEDQDPKFIKLYIDEIIPNSREFLREYEMSERDDLSFRKNPTDKYNHIIQLTKLIRDNFQLMEKLRIKYCPKFISPTEYIEIPYLNSSFEEKKVFSKYFLRKNFRINDFSSLKMYKLDSEKAKFMVNTFESGDDLLIKHDPGIYQKEVKISDINDGVYLIEVQNEYFIIGIQFPFETKFMNEDRDRYLKASGVAGYTKEKNINLSNNEIKEIKKLLGTDLKLADVDTLVFKYRNAPTFWKLVSKNKLFQDLGLVEDDSLEIPELLKLDKDIKVYLVADNQKPFLYSYEKLKIYGRIIWKSNTLSEKKKNLNLFEDAPEDLNFNIGYLEEKKLA